MGPAPEGVRLQRVLAAAGVAARRICEELILAGRVSVNGKQVKDLPAFVDPASDTIVVDGRPIPKVKPTGGRRGPGATLTGGRLLYLIAYKPEKVLSTTRDDAGRRTIMDYVDHPATRGEDGALGARLFPVGRLDFHMSGLVLLTNDGELANRLTHARYGVPKYYRVLAKGVLEDDYIADLERGLNLKHQRAVSEFRGMPAEDGGGNGPVRGGAAGEAPLPPIALRVVQREPGRTTLDIRLTETGPRGVPELLGEAGITVAKIQRTGIGPLRLTGVRLGQWRELTRDELRELRRVTGLTARSPKGEARPGTGPSGTGRSGPGHTGPGQASRGNRKRPASGERPGPSDATRRQRPAGDARSAASDTGAGIRELPSMDASGGADGWIDADSDDQAG